MKILDFSLFSFHFREKKSYAILIEGHSSYKQNEIMHAIRAILDKSKKRRPGVPDRRFLFRDKFLFSDNFESFIFYRLLCSFRTEDSGQIPLSKGRRKEHIVLKHCCPRSLSILVRSPKPSLLFPSLKLLVPVLYP